MTDLEALVVAAYVFADEYSVPAGPGRPALTSDLGLIGRVLPGWFPHLPEQSQYNRRLRALVELISIVQQQLARWLDAGGVDRFSFVLGGGGGGGGPRQAGDAWPLSPTAALRSLTSCHREPECAPSRDIPQKSDTEACLL
jgi:hypothetical protein